jgi:hypothetical protein
MAERIASCAGVKGFFVVAEVFVTAAFGVFRVAVGFAADAVPELDAGLAADVVDAVDAVALAGAVAEASAGVALYSSAVAVVVTRKETARRGRRLRPHAVFDT